MIGAIIGYIIGSVYEHDNIKTKDFPLFSNKCAFTDDTVLSVATAKWLLEGNECFRHHSIYQMLSLTITDFEKKFGTFIINN